MSAWICEKAIWPHFISIHLKIIALSNLQLYILDRNDDVEQKLRIPAVMCF